VEPDLNGRVMLRTGVFSISARDPDELRAGVYLFQFHTGQGSVVKRSLLEQERIDPKNAMGKEECGSATADPGLDASN
jgi:hypothetical protein